MIDAENRGSGGIDRSIFFTVWAYSLSETLFFLVIALLFSFRLAFFLLFLGIELAFHLIVYLYLKNHRALFTIIKTGERLDKINLANRITLLRITLAPVLLFLILALKNAKVLPILLPVVAFTFLTDLADGYVSRTRGEITMIGRILDSASDYLLLGIVAVSYYIFAILPHWLFWLIIFRLSVHCVLMLVLYRIRRKLVPETTLFGKVSVASTMTLLTVELLALIFLELKSYVAYIEIITGILIGLSVIDKYRYFIAAKNRKTG
ncbi:MAG: CDP-alcohol phosphatidyltransferase family protein [Treponema sp.]|jgi:phosphatidylglycerophosphate synthase|nr:CDP-alcohol phosphatidyltransferase family protein [Treponema sp.]